MPDMEFEPLRFDTKSRVANISWTAPINNRDLSYYAITVNDGPPMLTQNTSILYNLSSSNQEPLFSLRAVDRCGQPGRMARITVELVPLVVTPPENAKLIYNGVMEGIVLIAMDITNNRFYADN